MRRAALAFMLFPACSWAAPRIGVCPAPQSIEIGGWIPVLCGLDDGSEQDVWCVFEGMSHGRHCRALVETAGCGEWRIKSSTCGRAVQKDEV